jgi:hypothetical protein
MKKIIFIILMLSSLGYGQEDKKAELFIRGDSLHWKNGISIPLWRVKGLQSLIDGITVGSVDSTLFAKYWWAKHLSDSLSARADSINLNSTKVYNVKAYGAVGDGTTEDSTAIKATFAAAGAAGGGTVYFPVGTYKCSARLEMPWDDVTYLAKPILITGDVSDLNYFVPAVTLTGGSILDLRYAGTSGKLMARGNGGLVIKNMAFINGGNDSAPFITILGTTTHIYDCKFVGCAAYTNDGIHFGGASNYPFEFDGSDTSCYQGFNSIVQNNNFTRMRRAAYFRGNASGVIFEDNAIYPGSGLAAIEDDKSDGGRYHDALQINRNFIGSGGYGTPGYTYGILMHRTTSSHFEGNSIWDVGYAPATAIICLGVACEGNTIFEGYYEGTASTVDSSNNNYIFRANSNPTNWTVIPGKVDIIDTLKTDVAQITKLQPIEALKFIPDGVADIGVNGSYRPNDIWFTGNLTGNTSSSTAYLYNGIFGTGATQIGIYGQYGAIAVGTTSYGNGLAYNSSGNLVLQASGGKLAFNKYSNNAELFSIDDATGTPKTNAGADTLWDGGQVRAYVSTHGGGTGGTVSIPARVGYDTLGIFNVMSYGAIGDSISLDSAAVQNAENARVAAGGTGVLYFPKGLYRVGDIRLAGNIEICGDGVGNSIIYGNDWNRFLFSFNQVNPAPGIQINNIYIHDLTFIGRNNLYTGTAADLIRQQQNHLISFYGVKGVLIERVIFKQSWADGLYFGIPMPGQANIPNENIMVRNCEFDGVYPYGRNGISIVNNDGITIQDCYFHDWGISEQPGAIDVENEGIEWPTRNVKILNNKFKKITSNVAIVIQLRNNRATTVPSQGFHIIGNEIDSCMWTATTGASGIVVSSNTAPDSVTPPHDFVVKDNIIRHSYGGMSFSKVKGVKVINNTVDSCYYLTNVGNTASSMVMDILYEGNTHYHTSYVSQYIALQIGRVENAIFAKNIFDDCGRQSGAATGTAIDLAYNCTSTNMQIRNNIFHSKLGFMTHSIWTEGLNYITNGIINDNELNGITTNVTGSGDRYLSTGDGNAAHYLNGQMGWTVPGGSGDMSKSDSGSYNSGGYVTPTRWRDSLTAHYNWMKLDRDSLQSHNTRINALKQQFYDSISAHLTWMKLDRDSLTSHNLRINTLTTRMLDSAASHRAEINLRKDSVTSHNLRILAHTDSIKALRASIVSGGTVTSVTATTPLASSGGATPDISLTGIIASTYGGTGNGFTKFSGASSTEKTYALPNSSCNILTDYNNIIKAWGDTTYRGVTAKLYLDEFGLVRTRPDSTGTGITSLNGIYNATMTLALDTLEDGAPNWSPLGSTVTLNLPFARFARLLNPAFSGASISVGSDATGDLLYRKSTGYLERVGIGSTGQVLSVSGGLPAYRNPDSTGLGVALDLKASRYQTRDIALDTSYMRTANADTIRFFRTNRAIVVDSISVSCEGTSVNITLDFRFGYNAHGAGTALVNSPSALTNATNPNVISSFNTAAIPASRVVYFMVSAITTRQNSLITIYYH